MHSYLLSASSHRLRERRSVINYSNAPPRRPRSLRWSVGTTAGSLASGLAQPRRYSRSHPAQQPYAPNRVLPRRVGPAQGCSHHVQLFGDRPATKLPTHGAVGTQVPLLYESCSGRFRTILRAGLHGDQSQNAHGRAGIYEDRRVVLLSRKVFRDATTARSMRCLSKRLTPNGSPSDAAVVERRAMGGIRLNRRVPTAGLCGPIGGNEILCAAWGHRIVLTQPDSTRDWHGHSVWVLARRYDRQTLRCQCSTVRNRANSSRRSSGAGAATEPSQTRLRIGERLT